MDKSLFLARSFSQDSEDRIVLRLLGHRRDGFFIDIGAHHPYRFSNTALFSEMGWTGLNIDATPGVKEMFDAERPQDTNIWSAVGAENGHIEFRTFKESAYNSLNLNRVAPHKDGPDAGEVVRVPSIRIDELLAGQIAPDQKVDFVTLDVEGMEDTIIETYPFDTYRPEIFIVEDHAMDLNSDAKSATFQKMRDRGYRLRCQMMFSSIYLDANQG